MYDRPFAPAWELTKSVNNATSATTAEALPKSCEQIVLTNTSASARVHVMVTPYLNEADVPLGVAPTLGNGMPVLPGDQIRITVGPGCKVLRTIATAADGQIIITPGNGD